MKYNNQTYRNLQDQVWYLTNYLENEAQLVELGIRVVGAQASLPIPEGTYNYGDAYMIGTEAPFTMYVWTRANENYPEDYWFEVGPFPLPGPQGPKGDGFATLRMINTGRATSATYDTINGIDANFDATIEYMDSSTGESKNQTVSLFANTPIVPGKYISIGNDNSNSIQVGVDDTALALDYIKIDKTKNAVVPLFLGGSINWSKATESTAPRTIAYRDSNGDCNFNRINLSPAGFTIDGNKFDKTIMIYGLKSDFSLSDQTGGTISSNESYVINTTPVLRIKIQNKVYYRVSEFGKSPVRFMSCDSAGTISILTCNTTNKTYTISQATSTTYKHVTQMHVVIPGDDDYYLTIFNTDKHGAMYNLNSASTLLDNIGTAGTMAYKQNTANGVYMPVHVSKNSSGNWAWNMGSASGTFTTNQIDLITDDYETI